MTEAYLSGVRFFLNHRKTATVSFVAVLAAIAFLFKIVPGGLVPGEDQGNLLMAYSMPEASSLRRTTNFSDSVVKLLREDENVEDVLTVNGYNMLSSSQNTYSSISFIILKDWGLRENADQSADALAQLYTKFGHEPARGIGYAFSMPPIMGMSMSGRF